ncbi:unnamed protein product [Caenorhabditis auriculariae]|uniref:Uncharacterized protein n=1 Tax=Caenorhabditis auriculariae TaxID=2777116 RepID=A0A8S1H3T3_9PELO|nr:unnamed protein product [Caenorhabditis auriculariae]
MFSALRFATDRGFSCATSLVVELLTVFCTIETGRISLFLETALNSTVFVQSSIPSNMLRCICWEGVISRIPIVFVRALLLLLFFKKGTRDFFRTLHEVLQEEEIYQQSFSKAKVDFQEFIRLFGCHEEDIMVNYQSFQSLIYDFTKSNDLQGIKSATQNESESFIATALNLPSHWIPLVEACREGLVDIVRFLVQLGADPEVHAAGFTMNQNDDVWSSSESPLELAIRRVGSKDLTDISDIRTQDDFMIIRILVEEGKVDLRKLLGSQPPLFLALEFCNLELAKYLCEHGASVQDRNSEGMTCLMMSDCYKSPKSRELFNFFVEQGLSVDAVTIREKTAVQIAVHQANPFLVKLLTAEGAKLTCCENGDPLLFRVAPVFENPETEIFDHLFEYVKDETQKKDAMLLRAATRILRQYDEFAREELEYAFEYAYGQDRDYNLEKEDVVPNPAYDSLREARSYREFQAAEDKKRFTILQCFIIRERILGQNHPHVRHELFEYIQNESYETALDIQDNPIRCYMLSLYKRYERPSSGVYAQQVGYLIALLRERILFLDGERRAAANLVFFVFDQICQMLIESERPFKEVYPAKWSMNLCEAAARLISMVRNFGYSDDTELIIRFSVVIRRFAKIVTLRRVPLFHFEVFYMKPRLISVFVDAGANINELDAEGSTALAKYLDEKDKKTLLRNASDKHFNRVVKAYLRDGARMFVCTKNNGNIFGDLQCVSNLSKLHLGKFITLKDMAAAAVEANFSGNYLKKVLPQSLCEYIGLRGKDFLSSLPMKKCCSHARRGIS